MSDKSSKRYDQSKVANDQQNKTGDQQLRTANTPGILKVDEDDTTISTFYRRMRGCDGLESPFTSLTHTFERSFTSIATKPHLPSVIDTMVERPEKGADGKYDELEKEEWLTLYKMHAKQKALVKIEAKKAFNIIRAWQDPSSIALCEKDKSYLQANHRRRRLRLISGVDKKNPYWSNVKRSSRNKTQLSLTTIYN